MRMTLSGLLVLLLAANAAMSQGIKKKETSPPTRRAEVKADFSNLENRWGLKLKSFTVDSLDPSAPESPEGNILPQGRFTYVLEFQRDVVNYEFDALQKAFSEPLKRLRHVFLDEENIAINAIVSYDLRFQGEVSGVKGEVFRITIDFGHDRETLKVDPRGIRQAKKLVVRPG